MQVLLSALLQSEDLDSTKIDSNSGSEYHIVFERTVSFGDFSRLQGTSDLWVSGDKVSLMDRRQNVILRADLNKRWEIDPSAKTYEEHSLETTKKAESSIKSISDAGWEYIPVYDWIIRDIGEEKDIGGWKCHHYIFDGDADFSSWMYDLWVTHDAEADLCRNLGTYVARALFTEPELLKLYFGHPQLSLCVIIQMKSAKNLPGSPAMGSETKVTKIEKKPAPPGIFEPPQGFRKTHSDDTTGERGQQ